jgi:steroid 5-alpha reductase family enzyme
MDPLLLAALIIFGLNAAGYAYGYFRQSDKVTDLLYSLSFAAASAVCLLVVDPGNRHAAGLTLMVLVWAARLGGYLFMRIHKMERDARFDEMRPNAWRLAGFWLLQAITVWIVLLPLLLVLGASNPPPGGLAPDSAAATGSGGWLSLVGSGIWLAGLLMEALADWQKFRFRNNPANKGKFVNIGLWRWSRHPNYLGEMLVWIGFYVFALPVLGSHSWVALTSPLWIIWLLLRVSGIPLLEKSADKRYGMQQAYQDYKKQTALLIPYVW